MAEKTTSGGKLSHMRRRATVKNKFTHTGVVDVVFLDSKRVRNRMNSHSVQINSFNIVFRIARRVWDDESLATCFSRSLCIANRVGADVEDERAEKSLSWSPK